MIRNWPRFLVVLFCGTQLMAQTASNVPLPTVVGLVGAIRLGSTITIQLKDWRGWATNASSLHQLSLFLNGRVLAGTKPESVDMNQGTVHFHLGINDHNREIWKDLLRRPRMKRRLTVTVGPDEDNPFPSELDGAPTTVLEVVPSPWGIIAFAFLALNLALLILLGSRTDMLRDPGVPPALPARKPFSLARTQMAFWFFLILGGYAVIWMVTGDLNTITESLLGLMGISSGTALGATLIDNQKNLTKTVEQSLEPTPNSHGFLSDLLHDEGHGISIHRFQLVAWTILLGVIFVSSAYSNLAMPEFSPTLLGLMGISSGTYLGFKIPANPGSTGGAR